MLCIYIIELIVPMRVSGCAFLWNRTFELFWYWLDLIIVIGAVVEWCMPAFKLAQVLLGKNEGSHDGALGHIWMMLRLVRLLRIIRLARVIEDFPLSTRSRWASRRSSKACPGLWGLPCWCSTLPCAWG